MNGIQIFFDFSSSRFFSFVFALTQPASTILFPPNCSWARKSFFTRVLITTSSNSKAICSRSSSESAPDFSIRRSTSLFTAVFSQENEKSRESFSKRTSGNTHIYSPEYLEAIREIIAQPGKPSHIIFETLSKASQAASSRVCPIGERSNLDLQRYISVCPPETVSTIDGNGI